MLAVCREEIVRSRAKREQKKCRECGQHTKQGRAQGYILGIRDRVFQTNKEEMDF